MTRDSRYPGHDDGVRGEGLYRTLGRSEGSSGVNPLGSSLSLRDSWVVLRTTSDVSCGTGEHDKRVS